MFAHPAERAMNCRADPAVRNPARRGLQLIRAALRDKKLQVHPTIPDRPFANNASIALRARPIAAVRQGKSPTATADAKAPIRARMWLATAGKSVPQVLASVRRTNRIRRADNAANARRTAIAAQRRNVRTINALI